MENSIFTLRALAAEWNQMLTGCVITDIWSQHRGELIVGLNQHGQLHFRLHAKVVCAFRSQQSARARRNTITLLPDARGQRIRQVSVAADDRIVTIALKPPLMLHVYLFGPKANVYLAGNDGTVLEAFRHAKEWAQRPLPPPRSAALPATIDAFAQRWKPGNLSTSKALQRTCIIFNRTLVYEVMWRANVSEKPAAECTPQEVIALYESMQQLSDALKHPDPCIYTADHTFSLTPLASYKDASCRVCSTVDEALSAWAKRALAHQALADQRNPLLKTVSAAAVKVERRAVNLRRELSQASRAPGYEHFGHLLMAQPPQPPGPSSITVHDIITGTGSVTIPLKASLSTIQNAERYYAKAQKVRHARKQLSAQATQAKQRAQNLHRIAEELRAATSVAALNTIRKREAAILSVLTPQRTPDTRLPYRSYILAPGYEARVGKSARDSDELTQRHARPFDLWMHARGTPGAHVVLRMPDKKAQPPRTTLQEAAALAAYHSKARGSNLVPVTVTPRKFVRKPKGSAPGSMVVDREEVLIVSPALPKT